MGSGKLVKNYELLMKYFENLREMGVPAESSYPTGSDLSEVKSLVERGSLRSIDDAVRFLVSRYRSRVNIDAARKAVREVLGVDAPPEVAVEHVARLLALWTLEICESMGLIKIVGAEKYIR